MSADGVPQARRAEDSSPEGAKLTISTELGEDEAGDVVSGFAKELRSHQADQFISPGPKDIRQKIIDILNMLDYLS